MYFSSDSLSLVSLSSPFPLSPTYAISPPPALSITLLLPPLPSSLHLFYVLSSFPLSLPSPLTLFCIISPPLQLSLSPSSFSLILLLSLLLSLSLCFPSLLPYLFLSFLLSLSPSPSFPFKLFFPSPSLSLPPLSHFPLLSSSFVSSTLLFLLSLSLFPPLPLLSSSLSLVHSHSPLHYPSSAPSPSGSLT